MEVLRIHFSGASGEIVSREPLTAGMVGVEAAFTFDAAWNGLQKTAVFTGSGVTKDVVNIGGTVTIPWEVLAKPGPLFVGVYGFDGSRLVLPSDRINASVVKPGAAPSGDVTAKPSLEVWAQILSMIGDLSHLTTKDKSNLVAAINEAAASGGGTVDEDTVRRIVEEYLAENPAEYYLLKSPNGTIYKVVVTDAGTLQIIGQTGANLPDLIPGRLLVWNDEFEGDSVDLNKWYFRTFSFDGIFANPNATVHDGVLDMCVTKDENGSTTGATLMVTNGKAEFKYGRIEAKMKFDRNFHTALWCVGQTQTVYNGEIQGKKWCYSGEIDIYEPTDSAVYSTLHWGSEDETIHNSKRVGQLDVDYTEWHTYAVEWSETSMVFYCDDSVIGVVDNLDMLTNPDGFKPFNAPYYIILHAAHNSATVAGEYHCYVDWVRYYAPEDVSSLIGIQTLALSETKMSLNPNKVKELELVISPEYVTDYTLVWESDNTEVATFAGGNRITTFGNGTANLTVTAKNGVSAKCVLTVSEDVYNPVESIEIGGTEATRFYTGDIVQLSATVFPKWATNTTSVWESSDENIATVDNGTVTFVSDGTVDIYAKAADDSGVSASIRFTVVSNVVDNIPTGNCTVKMTRAGWNRTVDGSAGWLSDAPADFLNVAGEYVSGKGYSYSFGTADMGNNVGIGSTFNGDYTVSVRLCIPASVVLYNESRVFELTSENVTSSEINPRIYFGLFSTGNYILRGWDADGTMVINRYNKTGAFTPSDTETQCVNFTFVHRSDGTYNLYSNTEEIASGSDSTAMPETAAVFWMPACLRIDVSHADPDITFQAFVAYNVAKSADDVAVLSAALDEMYAT